MSTYRIDMATRVGCFMTSSTDRLRRRSPRWQHPASFDITGWRYATTIIMSFNPPHLWVVLKSRTTIIKPFA